MNVRSDPRSKFSSLRCYKNLVGPMDTLAKTAHYKGADELIIFFTLSTSEKVGNKFS